MDTLPDYLKTDLKIVSIGLNPSPISVAAGYYFANPRNRFWPALNGSRLVSEQLQPGVAAMERLLNKYSIGFTDLVKRPTPMSNGLRAADYREWAPVLQEKLLRYHPGIVWFHGKVTYRNYLKYTDSREYDFPLGLQKPSIGRSRAFVTPNPSPANARYSLNDLIRSYNEIVTFQVRDAFGL